MGLWRWRTTSLSLRSYGWVSSWYSARYIFRCSANASQACCSASSVNARSSTIVGASIVSTVVPPLLPFFPAPTSSDSFGVFRAGPVRTPRGRSGQLYAGWGEGDGWEVEGKGKLVAGHGLGEGNINIHIN